jgi:hypothetical protein
LLDEIIEVNKIYRECESKWQHTNGYKN